MDNLSVHKRQFNTLISHAYANQEIIGKIETWLISARISVWSDALHLPAGMQISSYLGQAIGQCPRCC